MEEGAQPQGQPTLGAEEQDQVAATGSGDQVQPGRKADLAVQGLSQSTLVVVAAAVVPALRAWF
ncbi:hypothetical protein GCM10010278_63110 [Streptomyces melanogenes]|nr:hypothetical protein GCM10010278_63110 [Streptomyces melanogenes]